MVCVCVFRVLSAKVWMAWVLLGMPGWVFMGVAAVDADMVETLFG